MLTHVVSSSMTVVIKKHIFEEYFDSHSGLLAWTHLRGDYIQGA